MSVSHEIIFVDVNKLKPHPKNQEIYFDPKDPEFDRSIQENGILKPIICNRSFIILDGHRRWKRAKQFGLKQVPVQIRDFENEILAIIWLNRYRVKTPREIFNEARVLEEELAKEAKKRQIEAGKKFGRGKLRSNLTEPISQPKVRDQVAEKLGVSSGQLYKIENVHFSEENKPESEN